MSGRDWSKHSHSVWRSPRYLGISIQAALLHQYFMTCEHQNSSGCYRIPDGYALSDLGTWFTNDQYQKARAELVAASLISFDACTSEVFVERWFKHNPPTNQKHAKGTMTAIGKIESDTLRERAEAEFMATEHGPTATTHPFDLNPTRSNSHLAAALNNRR